jgi:hypothetical protein
MNYPYTAEPASSFGFGINQIIVCDGTCADEIQAGIIDEMTDGEVESTEHAACAACGRIVILGGQLTYAHYKGGEREDS